MVVSRRVHCIGAFAVLSHLRLRLHMATFRAGLISEYATVSELKLVNVACHHADWSTIVWQLKLVESVHQLCSHTIDRLDEVARAIFGKGYL